MPATYVRVNLGAIAQNVRAILDQLRNTQLMAVVKGNAYGHGMVPVAERCVAAGAHWLGVSYVDEAVKLRESGVTVPTLAFVPPTEEQCQAAVEQDVTVTITTEAHLAWLREAAVRTEKVATAQIFVDADLGRPSAGDDLVRLLQIARGFPQLEVTGIYTHFDGTDTSSVRSLLDVVKPGSELQAFAAVVKKLAQQHSDAEIIFHAAASSLFVTAPDSHLDLVRIGTLLYGQYPSDVPANKRNLDINTDTFELRSTIVAIDGMPAGATVGYGKEFVCRRLTRVATLPLGYSQGLSLLPASLVRRRHSWWRRLDGKRRSPVVLIDGQQAPIIGRIGMDQCAVDVTDLPDIEVGQTVVVPTRRTVVSPEVPRVYVE
jgi:alanine racemase